MGISTRLGVLTVIVTLGGAGPAWSQRFEVGAMGGGACLGAEGSLCGGETSRTLSGYGSAWLSENLELQGRVVRLNRSDLTIDFRLAPPRGSLDLVRVALTERTRSLWLGQILYHFSRSKVRPFVGFGAGLIRDRETAACLPEGCENVPKNLRGGLDLGSLTATPGEWATSIGVRGLLRERAAFRAAITFHNFGGEHLATTDVSVGIGLRF
jgi:hypothetical protein